MSLLIFKLLKMLVGVLLLMPTLKLQNILKYMLSETVQAYLSHLVHKLPVLKQSKLQR
ncbi:hypothetical protein D3C81_2210790 [compost metagenome]